MSTRVSRFLCLGFIFSIALVLVFSPLTYAEIDYSSVYGRSITSSATFCVDKTATANFPGIEGSTTCYGNRAWRSNWGLNRIEGSTSTSGWDISGVRINLGGSSVPEGYLTFNFYGTNTSQQLNFTAMCGLSVVPNMNNGFAKIGDSYEMINSGMYRYTIYIHNDRDRSANTYLYLGSDCSSPEVMTSTPFNANFWWSRGLANVGFLASQGIWSSIAGNSSTGTYDYDILQTLYGLNTSVSSINSAISGLGANSQATLDAINELQEATIEANNDANDRYEDEKNTINDSRDEAEASANSMDTSGFSITNPFTTFFALFTDNACVSIPTIKSWIHSNESQVCSPWSGNNVRSVLTPVFSILSTLIIVGFVMRWLSSGNKEGTIEGI